MRAFASFSFYSFCSPTQDFLHLSIVRVKSNRVLAREANSSRSVGVEGKCQGEGVAYRRR